MALPSTGEQRIVPELNEIIAKYGGYPVEGDAQVLYKYRAITLDESNKEEVVTYLAIRINNEEAIPYYTQFSLHFDEYYETLNLDYARVLTQLGERHNLPKSAVQVKTANHALFYNQQKQLTFSVPQLMPGAIIEFQYTRKNVNAVIENHWFHITGLDWRQRNPNTGEYRYDSVGVSKEVISAPASTKLYLHGQNSTEIQQKEYHKDGRYFIELDRSNIHQTHLEHMMPPVWNASPLVGLTTLENWQQVNQWSYQTFLTGSNNGNQQEIDSLARQITQHSNSSLEKIKAIFAYVQQNIRYVYAHLGRGGFAPHSPDWTLKNGFGDCKDQSALLVALLNAAGIKAYPALYHTSEIYFLEQAPRLMFDHMIVYIPTQEGVNSQFLDTSNYKLQFPGISPKNNQAKAFVLGDNQGAFINIHQLDVANTVHITSDYQKIEEDKVTVEVTLTAKGYYDDYFRSIWLQSQDNKKITKDIITSIMGGEFIDLTVMNEKDLFKPVVIKAQLEYPLKGKLQDGLILGANYQQIARTFMAMNTLKSKEKRVQPLFNVMDLGITYITKISVEQDFYSNLIEKPRDIKTPYFSMTSMPLEGENMGIQMNVSIIPFLIPTKDTSRITVPFNDALENGNWVIQIKAGKLASSTSDDSNFGLQDVRNLIDRGEYQQALEQIELFLSNNEDAEGYFLKGLVLGFLNKHSDSDAAFDKAETLGYDI